MWGGQKLQLLPPYLKVVPLSAVLLPFLPFSATGSLAEVGTRRPVIHSLPLGPHPTPSATLSWLTGSMPAHSFVRPG